MHKTAYCLLLLLFSLASSAQQNRFIYIQTENKQPFYVKLDKKIFSSSNSGYVIIPKLVDGTYNLSIGFPKNESPVQNIQCTLDKQDAGYLLKDFGEKGWGLFNLQSLKILMANNATTNNSVIVKKEEKTDAFSNMLSEVVNDPSIKQTEIIVEVPKPELVNKEEVKAEPVEIVIDSKPIEVKSEAPIETITRTFLNTNADGTELIYIDKIGDTQDTIILFIPAEKEIQQALVETKVETIKEEKKQEVVVPVCSYIATTDDFIQLRKKMAATDTDNDMLVVAGAAFKTKCYSTTQIKNLSVLFLKDESKYQFFEAAYSAVTDKPEFKILKNELVEEFYINKFKELIN